MIIEKIFRRKSQNTNFYCHLRKNPEFFIKVNELLMETSIVQLFFVCVGK